MITGEGLARVGHERRLLGLHSLTMLEQAVERIAFDIVFGARVALQQLGELEHVAGANVALVGPWVHGDALGTRLERDPRKPDDAGDVERARVAQGGHFVDVDGQLAHGRRGL